MNRSLYIFFFCTLLIACESNTRPVRSCATFTELPDPTVDTLADWSGVKAGLHASFGSIDKLYAKSLVPTVDDLKRSELIGWRGERLSTQLLLWTAEEINQIEFEFSDFKSSDSKLESGIAKARFVRYVMTDVFEPGCGYRKPEDFPSSLSPDMLDNIDCFDMEAKTTRPVWISIDIPATASAGTYTGVVTLFARNQNPQSFDISLKVQDAILAQAKDWNYHLDLWQHPSAVARTEGLEVWSDEHFAAMQPIMKMLADAGQKVITATLNKDPWNHQCFDAYEDMIKWSLKANGEWEYDYTVFDRWVQFMMDLGVKRQINCYSLIPWNNEIHYFDQKSDRLINVKADPGTKIFADLWTPFLNDFYQHVKEKGWDKITNIAMDERAPKEMKAALDLLQQVAPDLGIALADNHQSYKSYPFIKDICVGFGVQVEKEELALRRLKNLVTTYYVCCSDKFPNMFSFSDPSEAVYAAWYTVAADFDGFLRWAYNSWVENPLTDSRFRTWPAGDTYIVYPQARSSIRFERLREGIQDAEKIRLLRERFTKENNLEALAKLEKLNKKVGEFNTVDVPTESCAELIAKAKKLLNELSE